MAIDAGGTCQRLNPGSAIIRSLEKKFIMNSIRFDGGKPRIEHGQNTDFTLACDAGFSYYKQFFSLRAAKIFSAPKRNSSEIWWMRLDLLSWPQAGFNLQFNSKETAKDMPTDGVAIRRIKTNSHAARPESRIRGIATPSVGIIRIVGWPS